MHNYEKILKNVIRDLPQQIAPEIIWRGIERDLNREENREALENAIEEYKTIEQSPLSWARLEASLEEKDNVPVLRKAIEQLPEHKLNHDLFERIVPKDAHTITKQKYLYWATSIAASLLIGIISYTIYTQKSNAGVTLTFSEEVINNPAETLYEVTPSEEDEVLKFIHENCNILADKCETPAFKELLDAYMVLDQSKKELLIQLEQHQDHLVLVEYLAGVEKEKTDIGNQLIQLLVAV